MRNTLDPTNLIQALYKAHELDRKIKESREVVDAEFAKTFGELQGDETEAQMDERDNAYIELEMKAGIYKLWDECWDAETEVIQQTRALAFEGAKQLGLDLDKDVVEMFEVALCERKSANVLTARRGILALARRMASG